MCDISKYNEISRQTYIWNEFFKRKLICRFKKALKAFEIQKFLFFEKIFCDISNYNKIS